MTEWSPSEEERRRIFEQHILPIVFPNQPASEQPTLLLLGGQPGAGNTRATARLLSEYAGMGAISGDDLGAFHPHFLELVRSRSVEASQVLAETTAGWLRDCLVHARTSGRSLLLEGAFYSPEVALGAADLFAGHGFATRVVVVATGRPESLLSTASRYLLDARAGRASRFTSLSAHDTGYEGTHELIRQLGVSPSVDRLSIIGRDGAARYDAHRMSDSGFAVATGVLDRERSLPMSAARSMGWLSELRAMADFALTSGNISGPLAKLLIELHQIALHDVIRRLPLPPNSEARPMAEANVARQLLALRRAMAEETRTADVAAPAIPSTPQPERGIAR